MLSGKWQPFCLSLSVLTHHHQVVAWGIIDLGQHGIMWSMACFIMFSITWTSGDLFSQPFQRKTGGLWICLHPFVCLSIFATLFRYHNSAANGQMSQVMVTFPSESSCELHSGPGCCCIQCFIYLIHSVGDLLVLNLTYSISEIWITIQDFLLTHWVWATHLCIGNLTIISSDNGLLPGWHLAIIWTNAGILVIGPLGTNYSEILIKIQIFSFMEMHLKWSSGKWWPFCLGFRCVKENPYGNVCKIVAVLFSSWCVGHLLSRSTEL